MKERAQSSRSSSNPDYLVVGTLGRAVGVRGELELTIVSDDPVRFAPGSVVLLDSDHTPLTVRSHRRRRAGPVVAFVEITDRTVADALRGADLVIPLAGARALGPQEYWDHDLVGCRVETTGGDTVGTVTEVLHTAANDVLVVNDGEEVLVPLISDVVRSIDPRRRIVIDPLPGLLGD